MWSWPFSSDGEYLCTSSRQAFYRLRLGMAPGAYTREKFVVCLPFNKGGTGDKNGTVSPKPSQGWVPQPKEEIDCRVVAEFTFVPRLAEPPASFFIASSPRRACLK